MTHSHSSHSGHDHESDSHDHAHGGDGHGHVHAPADFGRAFAIGMALNLGFVVAEAFFGVLANSVALLSDAGHRFLRTFSALAPLGSRAELVKRAPSGAADVWLARLKHSCGPVQRRLPAADDRRDLMGGDLALRSSCPRRGGHRDGGGGRRHRGQIASPPGSSPLARRNDINLRGAFLHMASDALVSAGVVVAGFAMMVRAAWLDPLVSLAINAFIVWGTWGLLRESLAMSMAAVPSSVDPAAVRAFLVSRPGVASLHDFHVWPMGYGTETAL